MTDMVIAMATAATAIVALITAVLVLLAKLNRDVQEVHVLVNSRMREALVRITQLHNALIDANVDVPDNGRET